MALKIPTTLKLTQLKALAFKCGISTSGTKDILTQRLQHDISVAGNLPRHTRSRILSIDMGIRNLGYCVLDVPNELLSSSTQTTGHSKLPRIDSWHRIAVSPTLPNTTKEEFSPANLSATAYKLLRYRLLEEKPSHILIERQRFRSTSSKFILEWTLRVNTFESIIYGILCTLQEERIWSGQVVGILPGKVGPYWVGDDQAGEEGSSKVRKKIRNSKTAKIISKGLKIDLVRSWLEADDVVELGNKEVAERARLYVEKWDRLPGGRKGFKRGEKAEGEGEKMGKLDDLADCLLQGIAWIRWERNKRIALEEGVEALLGGTDTKEGATAKKGAETKKPANSKKGANAAIESL